MGIKDKLNLDRVNGYWSILPLVQVHEIMGLAGFEFAIVDLEHGTYSFQEALEAVSAIESAGMDALIRPSSHDPKEILRCLEIGVSGICVPQVDTAEQAMNIVSSIKYSPEGKRGSSGFTRATRYGLRDFCEHRELQNKSIFVVMMIESADGLSNLREIAAVDGVDCIYFGTYDIATDLGMLDQDSAEMNSIISSAIDSLGETDLSFGQVAVGQRQYELLDPRIRFVPCGVDCGVFMRGAKNHLDQMRL